MAIRIWKCPVWIFRGGYMYDVYRLDEKRIQGRYTLLFGLNILFIVFMPLTIIIQNTHILDRFHV